MEAPGVALGTPALRPAKAGGVCRLWGSAALHTGLPLACGIAFRAGGTRMQMRAKVPNSIVSVMQALVIISVVASQMLLEIWNEHRLKKAAMESKTNTLEAQEG